MRVQSKRRRALCAMGVPTAYRPRSANQRERCLGRRAADKTDLRRRAQSQGRIQRSAAIKKGKTGPRCLRNEAGARRGGLAAVDADAMGRRPHRTTRRRPWAAISRRVQHAPDIDADVTSQRRIAARHQGPLKHSAKDTLYPAPHCHQHRDRNRKPEHHCGRTGSHLHTSVRG